GGEKEVKSTPFSGKGYSLKDYEPEPPLELGVQGVGLYANQFDDEDPELAHAIAMSLQEGKNGAKSGDESMEEFEDGDASLEAAILMSLQQDGESGKGKRKEVGSGASSPSHASAKRQSSSEGAGSSQASQKEETDVERMRRLRLERFG
ncbi:hypothetical protein HDV05_008664, partial [Chytridiales sp. JEL 0842]